MIRRLFRGLHFGRWSVISAATLATAFFVGSLVNHRMVFSSAWQACVIAFAVMGVLGIGEQRWHGKKVKDAHAGGVGLGLEEGDTDVVAELRRTFEAVNDRVGELTHDVNKRLFDLESHVFKDPTDDSDAAN